MASADVLLASLAEFINASTWPESRQILDRHHELLSVEVDGILASLAKTAQARNDERTAKAFIIHRRLLARCREVGSEVAFGELVSGGRAAVPADVEELQQRAVAALEAFGKTGSLEAVSEAISALHTLIAHPWLASAPESVRATVYGKSGLASIRRFEVLGHGSDLEAAIEAWQEALRLTPPESHDRARLLSNLGGGLRRRCGATGAQADLDEAIGAWQEALSLTPPGSPDRPMLLTNLGSGLGDRYGRTGAPADIDGAIEAYKEALRLTPPESPDRAVRFTNLGIGLGDRYERTGAPADLDAAIVARQEALRLTPPESPDRPGRLANLGIGLIGRHRRTGAGADLDGAIEAYKEALRLTPPESPDRPAWLSNLGISLRARYGRAKTQADLDAAIEAHEEALRLTPPESPDRPARLNNLGIRLRDRDGRAGAEPDLEVVIDAHGAQHERGRVAAAAQELMAAITEFVNAPSWPDSRQILDRHPELLSAEVDGILASIAEAAQTRNEERAAEMLSLHRRLLRRSREVGSEVAFNELVSGRVAAVPADVEDLQQRAITALQTYDQAGSLEAVSDAIAASEGLIAHPWLASAAETVRAAAHGNSGLAFIHRFQVLGHGSDVEAAIAAWQEALRLTPPESPARPRWLNDLGSGLGERYRRSGDETDLEAAIAAWREALRLTPPESPDRPRLLNNLGGGLRDLYRRSGDETDLDGAIETRQEALRLSPPGSPDRPGWLTNLGNALRDRYEPTGSEADLDGAIAAYQEALRLSPSESLDRPRQLSNLGNSLIDRYERTGAEADLEAAIEASDEGLRLTPPESPERPRRLTNLAHGLVARYGRTGAGADLGAAITAWQEALGLTPPESPDRPRRLSNLGSGLGDRYGRTGAEADLDGAIEAWQEALRLSPPESPDRPWWLSNLGSSLIDRYGRSGAGPDLSAAIEASEEALRLTPPESPDRPRRLSNLGNGLSERYGRKGTEADLEAAIEAYEEALRLTLPESPDRARWLTNLGNGLGDRYRRSGAEADLEAAIEAWREALRLTPPESPDRPRLLGNLGTGLIDRYRRSGAEADLEAATEAYRTACVTGRATMSAAALSTALAWSGWAISRSVWDQAVEAGEHGLQVADALVRVQGSRSHQESWLRDAQGLARQTAYAWVRQGDRARAVVAAERGRAVLLAEALRRRIELERLEREGHIGLLERYRDAAERLASSDAQRLAGEAAPGEPVHRESTIEMRGRAKAELEAAIAEIQTLPGHEGFLLRPSDQEVLEQVTAASESAPVAYLVAAEPGGIALIVGSDHSITVAELSGLTESGLQVAVTRHLAGYNSFRARGNLETWLAALDSTTRWLWDAAIGPLLDELRKVGTEQVTLVPTGVLGLLPLHAAWVKDESCQTGRRYALDELLIRYAPNAQSIVEANRVADTVRGDSLLAIDDPWPVTGPPLAGSAHEVAAAAAVFPTDGVRILSHHSATRKDVLEALPGRAVIHLSCHGRAVAGAPLESSLLMARDERLTLRDILEHRLEGTRLVVLSACETALPGTAALDEVISLPTGLLQAGAASAIGSLWSVEDLATMVLLSRFYRLWRTDGLAPAEALRQAQRWTRDLTAEERDRTFVDVDMEASGERGLRPYGHPFWWAAFGFTGA